MPYSLHISFISAFGDKKVNLLFSVIEADIVICIICLIVFRTKKKLELVLLSVVARGGGPLSPPGGVSLPH